MPKFRNIRIKKPGGGTRIQRAQVLKSGKLKFVKNIKRGGRKAAKKAPARKRAAKKSPARKPARRKSVAKKSNPGNRSPKIGAAIQAFKGAQPLVSPVIESGVRHGLNEAGLADLRTKVNLSYAGNVGMTAVNNAVDRKIGQGAALTRGSATAWIAEGVGALGVINEVKGQSGRNAALAANRKIAQTLNAYNPNSGRQDFTDSGFRAYQGTKIVGGVIRRASNIGPFKKIFAPVKKFLGQMGGAL